MLRAVLSFFGSFFSGPITQISNDIKEAIVSKQNAKTEQERIAADERINLLEARKSIILAAQRDPYERFVRVFIAFGVALYLNKIFVWDKVLEWGSTDPLSPFLTDVLWVVLGGYFLDTIVGRFKR